MKKSEGDISCFNESGIDGKGNDKGCSEKLREADFVAIIYRNNLEYNKHVYISLKQIYKYLRKRYSYIETIIASIKKQNEEKICELRNKHILLPEECKDYDSYLSELKKAIEELCGDNSSWLINK